MNKKPKKIRKFNGKEFTFHKSFSTMIEVRNTVQELKGKGFSVRVVSYGGVLTTGAIIYKRKK